MFCRIDISLLLLGGLLQFTTSLGWIHCEALCFHGMIFVLVVATATRPAAATATTTGARSVGEGTPGRTRRLHTATFTATGLLVGLLRQLEDLAKLLALVGLHRLLHVSEPLVCHFV